MQPIREFSVIVALALAAACSDSNGLADPTISNVVDTVTLGALEGTSVQTPSAYSIQSGAVRTDQSDFEFAYNVDSTGRRVFLPRSVLGLTSSSGAQPGLQGAAATFDAITV